MPLHVEAVCEDLREFLLANMQAALDIVVAEGGEPLMVSAPLRQQYFLGERNQFRGYQAPCCFIAVPRTTRLSPGQRASNILVQEHRVMVDFLVEGTGEEELTRAAFRMAQAADGILNHQDITPSPITSRSTYVEVQSVDYGALFANRENIFRKDVWLDLTVKHWDQLLPTPAERITYGQAAVVVQWAPGISSDIAVAVSDVAVLATPTSPISFAVGATGTYTLEAYYRVSAPTTVTLTLTYNDGAAQVVVLADGAHGDGSYTCQPTFFSAVAGSTITLTAVAGVAGLVTLSATLRKGS